MTATRTVTGNVTHIDGTAWTSASVKFELLTEFVTSTGVQPLEVHTETTDASGDFSIDLAVPDTGTAFYQVVLPDIGRHEFYLDAGAATDIQTVLAALTSSTTPSALQAIIDAANKANVKNKTAAYPIVAGDEMIRCTNGPYNVTLPAATGSGVAYCVKNLGAGAITVNCTGGDLIDGDATKTLAQYDRITVLDAASGVWDLL